MASTIAAVSTALSASLAAVTAFAAIFPVVTFKSTIDAVSTALSASLAAVTASLASLAVEIPRFLTCSWSEPVSYTHLTLPTILLV